MMLGALMVLWGRFLLARRWVCWGGSCASALRSTSGIGLRDSLVYEMERCAGSRSREVRVCRVMGRTWVVSCWCTRGLLKGRTIASLRVFCSIIDVRDQFDTLIRAIESLILLASCRQ